MRKVNLKKRKNFDLPESDSESSVSESSSEDSESCSVLEITFLLCGQRFFR